MAKPEQMQHEMQIDEFLTDYKRNVAFLGNLASWIAFPVEILTRTRLGFRNLGPFAILITCGILIAYGFSADDPLAVLKTARASVTGAPAVPAAGAPGSALPFTSAGISSDAKGKLYWYSQGRSAPHAFSAPMPSDFQQWESSRQDAWANEHYNPQREREAIREPRQPDPAAQPTASKAETEAARQERKDYRGRRAVGYLGLIALIAGFWKRRYAWQQIKAGNHWHTRVAGLPYLQYFSPFRDRTTSRIIEPIALVVLGSLIRPFLPALGMYVIVSGVCIFVMEQALLNRDVARYLDYLDAGKEMDSHADDEAHHERLLGNKAPTGKAAVAEIERRGGIPTAPAPELIDEAKKRRELAAAAVAAAEEDD